MAVLTVYLYPETGTNLKPISPLQKLFSQSFRNISFETSALLMNVTEIWIEQVQVFGREQQMINLSTLPEEFTDSKKRTIMVLRIHKGESKMEQHNIVKSTK